MRERAKRTKTKRAKTVKIKVRKQGKMGQGATCDHSDLSGSSKKGAADLEAGKRRKQKGGSPMR